MNRRRFLTAAIAACFAPALPRPRLIPTLTVTLYGTSPMDEFIHRLAAGARPIDDEAFVMFLHPSVAEEIRDLA